MTWSPCEVSAKHDNEQEKETYHRHAGDTLANGLDLGAVPQAVIRRLRGMT